MSGINSIVGLNKVDVDYRPEIKNPTDKIGTDKVLDGANVEPVQEEVMPVKGEGRSVMQQLDVLLLNAANRSIAEDSAQKTKAMGKTLQELGVITKDESNNIAKLSTTASGMLAALDKLTGAEIAGDAAGKLTEEDFHDGVDGLNNDIGAGIIKDSTLRQLGYSIEAAARMVEAMDRLDLFATQFLQLMKSTTQFANGGTDPMVTAGDIRRMMLGELSVSSVVEARARGFNASDVNTKADDANIVDSKPLDGGQTASTFLLTTKSGEKLVFMNFLFAERAKA